MNLIKCYAWKKWVPNVVLSTSSKLFGEKKDLKTNIHSWQ